MKLEFQVQLKIRKPVAEVFEAVVNPDKLSGYFVQESSGPLVEGATVQWKFPEIDQRFPVTVKSVVPNERIVFVWGAEDGSYDTTVQMAFKPLGDGATMVQVTEGGWRETEAGLKASHGNAGGWMHMLACLKAYLEYGINLRAGGAF
jgi:uncharacterized protein YndB with AHSA1/START domain